MRLSIPMLLSLSGILLASPSAEAAVDRQRAMTLAPQAEFSLRTDNGYAVRVEGAGRSVSLTVERGFGVATYLTRGTAWPGGIRARFGHFGRISVRFEQLGKPRLRKPPRRCRGKAAIVRSGLVAGTIRFEGEDGYVSIDARRAKGQSSTQPRWRCEAAKNATASARRKEPRFEEANLEASLPKERASFLATGLHAKPGPSLIFFVAGTRERRGSVRIGRVAVAISERARTFSFEGTRAATVRPPRPFHGSAVFERDADGTASWTGTLSISLPGATVPLAGPAFKAKLTQPNAGGGPLRGAIGPWMSPPARLSLLAAP